MSKHTPGPWAQSAYRLDEIVAIGRDRNSLELIAAVERLPGRHDEAKANARLISAAPDLLDALTHLVWVSEAAMRESNRDGGEYDVSEILSPARAAIAKATGEAA